MHHVCFCLSVLLLLLSPLRLDAEVKRTQMRTYLQERVLSNPDDAASHRLLGRLLLDEGSVSLSIKHLQLAVDCNPTNAAARFDLGNALAAAEDFAGAREQWETVVELAPDTDYATNARENLATSSDETADEVTTVSYEVRDFPGPPEAAKIDELTPPPTKSIPVFLRFESGILYNSNVALAPSSRQLASGTRESFQLFASPELEWWAVSKDNWVAGPLFGGYFTWNEEDFQNFNLASYSPGIFLERLDELDDSAPVLRVEYRYGLDEFGGRKFSTRHSAVARLTTFQTDGATTGYLAIDQTNFVDDGLLPEVTSADGCSYATGVAREFALEHLWIRQFRLGLDLDRLDSSGTDFAYWGAGASAQTVTRLASTVDLTLKAGMGYRIFDRYQFDPDRDEIIWRSAAELRKWFTPQLSMAAVLNYQMFDSHNPLFASDRIIGGVTMQYLY